MFWLVWSGKSGFNNLEKRTRNNLTKKGARSSKIEYLSLPWDPMIIIKQGVEASLVKMMMLQHMLQVSFWHLCEDLPYYMFGRASDAYLDHWSLKLLEEVLLCPWYLAAYKVYLKSSWGFAFSVLWIKIQKIRGFPSVMMKQSSSGSPVEIIAWCLLAFFNSPKN